MLVNHADAETLRVGRTAYRNRLPAHRHRAAVGRVNAGNDVHEGRFTGAVLAEKGVDFPGLKIEIHAAQSGEFAECLEDARQCKDRRGIGAIRATAGSLPHMARHRVHCWLITPFTYQSMAQRSPSDKTSPALTRSLPSRSLSGPA